MTAPATPHEPCPSCRAPLVTGQRYCLQCGARRGAERVDYLHVLGLEAPRPAPLPVPAPAPRGRMRRWAPTGVAVVAVSAGVVLGWLTGPSPAPSQAATPSRVVLLEAAAPTPAAAPVPIATPTPTPKPAKPKATATATAEATVAATAAPAATAEAEDDDPVAAATPTPTATATPTPAPPPVLHHVWLVTLSGIGDAAAFSTALGDLAARGTLLSGYAPIAASGLAGGVAVLSGQAPTAATRAGCPAPAEIDAGRYDTATGLVSGDGCRYPAVVLTLPGQLAASGLVWRAYAEDPAATPCPGALAAFHSLSDCAAAGFDRLASDLGAVATTPALSLLAPATAASLQTVVAQILAAPAYADGGLVAILPDAATGALLLSPLVTAGATAAAETGPYALLRTLEDAFGLLHLGHAADADVSTLGAGVFPAATASTTSNKEGSIVAHRPAP